MLRVLFKAIRALANRFAGIRGSRHTGLALGIAAACFMSNGYSAPPTAADRVFLGDSTGIPLAASANPETARTLGALRRQAADNGAVRVIVGVRAAFAPEGLLSAGNAALQRDEIAAVQSAALDKVASLKGKPEKIKRFGIIPFMAVEAAPAELEALVNLPEITSIEEDRIAEPALVQSVPLIGGATAWSGGYTGAGRAIAVLDTGVEKTHPFLAGKVVSEACYSTTSATYGSTSICPGGVAASTATGSAMPYTSGVCPAGECDHGTHVAGIAAGKGAGYSGVAKDASLIAIQVFSKFQNAAYCGSATPCALANWSDQILGLERVYALRNTYNIAAANVSIGGGQYFTQSNCDSVFLSYKAAIDTLRSANIATVISAGNSGYTNSMGAPACISSAVSVGATWDAAGNGNNCAGNNLGASTVNQIACYSNSASFLKLLAPGSLIASSIPGGAYSNYQGTSMAAPHVAGAWALLKQKNQSLTVTAGLNAMASTGVPVTDPRNGIVKPRIQVNAALNAIASGCTYTLSPAGLSAGAAAAIGNVGVTTTPGCTWTARSNAAWITVTSGASGSGSGQVGYSIAANTGVGRTGTLAIAGKTFTVTQNGAGTLPAAPAIGAATAGNASARVAFTPGAVGSGTLLNYTAMCGNIAATGTSPIMVLGLTNGTPYNCKVRATSTVGAGPWSAVRTVTPSAALVLPAAPAIGAASAGNASARVTFAPGANGSGAPLYFTAACGNITATGGRSPITVSGLTNGTPYKCRVNTTSTVGVGPWSVLSNTVIPSNATLSACTTITPPTASVTLGAASPLLAATCNNGPTSYVWKVGTTTLAGCTGATCTVPAANLPAAGTYSVTVRANNAAGAGTQAASATITVSSIPLSACTITPTAPSVTLGQPSPQLTANCTNSPTAWAWKLNGAAIANCPSTAAICTVPAASLPIAGGVYNVTVTPTNAGGVGGSSPAARITVSPLYTLPAAPTIGAATTGNGSAMVAFTPGAIGSGALLNYTAMCGTITAMGASSPIMVSGLVNGTPYNCKVRTTSTAGIGPWSAASNQVTPLAPTLLPVAPAIGTASAGNGSAMVVFTPGATGSGALLHYTAECQTSSIPGGGTASITGTKSPLIVSGLTNGFVYYCGVKATTTVGASPWSASSNPVTPSGWLLLPNAPTIGTATTGNGSTMVSFTPGAIGSGALLYYTVECLTPSLPPGSGGVVNTTGTSSPLMVSGLTNGLTYYCGVKTTTTVGAGSWSAISNTVTPSAALVLPTAPAIGAATAGNGSITVAFTPGAMGGGTLLHYTAHCGTPSIPGGGSVSNTGTGSPILVSGLTNGFAYNCYVKTTTTVGIGSWSASSNQVTPSAPDTGIAASQCYQAGSDALVSCNSIGALALNNAQDGMKGRDANAATNGNTDGKLGFSFTSFNSVSGGCVLDNVTGLMWEIKATDGGFRDWNKTYTNYSPAYDPGGQYGTATDAAGFVAAVNSSGLCGHGDWRLPTADELQSIVDYGAATPGSTIDATWFPNTQSGWFWSASPGANYSYNAWYVNFGDGGANYSIRSNSNYVRLVRGGQTPILPRYTVSADGQEVADNQTGLIWRRCAEGMVFVGGTCTGTAGTFTHESALQRAAAQAGSTGIAWRLPNIKELAGIVDKSRSGPAIDTTAFPVAPATWFWSSSPVAGNPGNAWGAYFVNGVIVSDIRGGGNYVQLVRGGL